MTDRSIISVFWQLLVFSMMLLASDVARAGVQVDANGFFTQWFDDDTGTTVFFYQGSFQDANAAVNLQDETWWGNSSIADSTAFRLFQDSGTALDGTDTTHNAYYIFTSGFNQGVSEVQSYFVWSDGDLAVGSSNWLSSFPVTSTSDDGDPGTGTLTAYTFYFAYVSNSASVPEPNTAIALGLLGVCGFAGGRRRRS